MRQVVGSRFALYPQPTRSDGAWAAWWADYVTALQDFSPAALEAAMIAHIGSPEGEFLPKPHRLAHLARTVENGPARAVGIAMRVADIVRSREEMRRNGFRETFGIKAGDMPVLREMPTSTSRAEVRRLTDEWLAQARARQPVQPTFRANHGAVDASGITPQLRELLSRRADRENAAAIMGD